MGASQWVQAIPDFAELKNDCGLSEAETLKLLKIENP